MSDTRLLAGFRDRSLPAEAFTHRAHLRVAYLHLVEDAGTALDRMRAGILAFNDAHGVAAGPDSGYHETLTVAWVTIVAARLAASGPLGGSAAFLDRHADLLDKRLLLRHYSRERIMSSEARCGFLVPDLEPFP